MRLEKTSIDQIERQVDGYKHEGEKNKKMSAILGEVSNKE